MEKDTTCRTIQKKFCVISLTSDKGKLKNKEGFLDIERPFTIIKTFKFLGDIINLNLYKCNYIAVLSNRTFWGDRNFLYLHWPI